MNALFACRLRSGLLVVANLVRREVIDDLAKERRGLERRLVVGLGFGFAWLRAPARRLSSTFARGAATAPVLHGRVTAVDANRHACRDEAGRRDRRSACLRRRRRSVREGASGPRRCQPGLRLSDSRFTTTLQSPTFNGFSEKVGVCANAVTRDARSTAHCGHGDGHSRQRASAR